ncbi:hypothetical protein CHS0354_006908 [Potamilus streckersoni]|uniref:ATP-grasp domain-containing protein n=1 Tax=Potamilus streckersoni TaxID=2493646 RepID=A0AAE0WCU7_9BIVA|nr:hypothetical protein CHS0354_006908 [Potamilus streckersoni]
MNKSATKKILHHAGIPVCKFREITRNEAVPSYQAISRELGAVVFVKPNCLGSSVGISKCRNEAEYLKGVEEAFLYDTKVLIEEDFSGREIEFAVMGNHTAAVSPPGEIVPDREFYSYDSKYDPASKTDLKVPTQLPPDLLKEMTVCAEKAYRETECQGLCRVDFLLKSDGRYVVNELNTLPGFTKISMFPALFKLTGRSYSEIIGRLIELAEERHRESAGLRRTQGTCAQQKLPAATSYRLPRETAPSRRTIAKNTARQTHRQRAEIQSQQYREPSLGTSESPTVYFPFLYYTYPSFSVIPNSINPSQIRIQTGRSEAVCCHRQYPSENQLYVGCLPAILLTAADINVHSKTA